VTGAELPADIAVLLGRLRDGLFARGGLVGIYLYGSLVTGDFSPSCSDIDVVVMVEREPDEAAISELRTLHEALAGAGGVADRLHCLYVPTDSPSYDPYRLHAYWYGTRMTQWQLKVMTQAELASVGVAFHGPWPPPGVTPVPVADIQAAVYEELRDYWRRTARRWKPWLRDSWIDLGLTVLPRISAVLTSGELITKTEAISRLADFGVPAWLAGDVRGRRDGQVVRLGGARKVHRALVVRRIMRRSVRRLSRLVPQVRELALFSVPAPAGSGGGRLIPSPDHSGDLALYLVRAGSEWPPSYHCLPNASVILRMFPA
jgi:predicted nucleotidyltransferase